MKESPVITEKELREAERSLPTMVDDGINALKKLRQERQSKKTSPFWGVSRYNHKYNRTSPWIARLQYKNKDYYIGCYKTQEQAAHAYDTIAGKFLGFKAKLNFPESSG